MYGPWGRPDMALFLFAEAMLKGRPIEVFNRGNMIRDFTYIDDVAEGVIRSLISKRHQILDSNCQFLTHQLQILLTEYLILAIAAQRR